MITCTYNPETHVLVPKEPTDSDINDALDAASLGVFWDDDTDAAFPREFAVAFHRALLAAAPQQEEREVASDITRDEAYDKIDFVLRTRLYDDDYAEFSQALDILFAHQPPPAKAEGQEAVGDGWLQDGGLLYRLTDGRRPENRDEINVTMADGSRSAESRTRRAGELLDRIRSTTPPRREWVESTLEEKVILLLQHGCGERIPLLVEFEELLKGKNNG